MNTIALINNLFDHIKEQHALPSDSALARHIGVPDMYIWRWRRGEFGTSTDVLAPLLITYGPTIPRSDLTPAQIAA
jgi:hypothetical protein